MAVVASFLIGCAFVVVVGCAGVRSGGSQEEQGHTEATERDARSPEATTEEARCEGTRTFKKKWWGGYRLSEHLGVYTTNDVPGCPTSGLLSGSDKRDSLDGKEGDDNIHGLGGVDSLFGGRGNDVIYGGPGADTMLVGDAGDDDLYGGDGNENRIGMNGGGGDDVLYGGMATIPWADGGTTIRTSSIAVKVGTNTLPTSSTMWTAVAR
jgi:hypothetical protein